MADHTWHDWMAAAEVCREVAELPDRTSPDDNPDFMHVTADELQPIVASALAAAREEGRRAALEALADRKTLAQIISRQRWANLNAGEEECALLDADRVLAALLARAGNGDG